MAKSPAAPRCTFNPSRCAQLVEAHRRQARVDELGWVERWSKSPDSSGVFFRWEFHFSRGSVEHYWSAV